MRYAASSLVEICGESTKPSETESSRPQQSQEGNGGGRDHQGSQCNRKQTRSSPQNEINRRRVVRQFVRRPKMPPLILKAIGTLAERVAAEAEECQVGFRIVRPMDWFLPPFFLPPLIGHAQKQILTSYSTADKLGEKRHFRFSQPS